MSYRMPGSKSRVARGIHDERTDLYGDPSWLDGDVGAGVVGSAMRAASFPE